MTPPLHLSLSVTVYDGATPVLLVTGIPDHPEEVAFLVDGRNVRTLRPVRGIPARLPDRPITPGLPSLAAILRGAAAPSDEEHADA
ncbi:hypothetical protein HL658_31235 [Azospirillum sp. RWY-5-1]|uniref:Uncharacterized protein n=1 Tax=Azospirillum oleiclasticum TaxID=2735135 RepID=A0ABX2TMB6_9PROT|nr:hypothetical protein [Azospirillum oleiclasticum]NYZ17039.1 hypothetical protein [Azospirillum oleiclasticum]NYZ24517.1 hypothetical protein [Azospirillum oleiclasticum]